MGDSLDARDFWRHPVFQRLSDLDRTVALYLFHGPQSNGIGLFCLSVREMAQHLDRDYAAIREALDRVWKATGWQFDAAKEVVWLPAWWAYRLPQKEPEFKRVLLSDLPPVVARETPLTGQFFAKRKWVPRPWHHLLDDMMTRKFKVPMGSNGQVDWLEPQAGYVLQPEGQLFSEQVVALWNEIVTPPIPKVRWSRERGDKVDTRRKIVKTLEEFRRAFDELNRTAWCRGEGRDGSTWVADFDFIVKTDRNLLRFVEASAVRAAMVQRVRVPNCRHTPPCINAADCTAKFLADAK